MVADHHTRTSDEQTDLRGSGRGNGHGPVTLDSRVALLQELTRDGALALPPGLPYETWAELVATLQHVERNVQWWLGDAIAYGEREYGELAYQAIGADRSSESVRNYARVSERIPPGRRLPDVSWSHHQAVAGLPDPADQDEVLAQARAGGWNVHRTRAHVRKLRTGEPEPDLPHDFRCPRCHHEWDGDPRP